MSDGSFSPSLGRAGPYEILDLLGQGGMAAVYLARDTRDDSQVALKVLARMRPSWVHRFTREFEAAQRVDHPNVVRVLEAGDEDGLAYFSMERVEGVTAARYVLGLQAGDPLPPPPPPETSGPLPKVDVEALRRTLQVAIQLAGAVGAIHEVGLVHRDLKPGNVLVTKEGVVKLVDFGVAKWLEEQTSFTQVGHVVGSYSYMAPEQITGNQVDHRADQYGMGVLLYELLTGAPPFRARRPQEYLWLHCTAAPDPLSRRLEGIPPRLDQVLLTMLAKEPADRFENMRQVEGGLLSVHEQVEGGASIGSGITTTDSGPIVSTEGEEGAPHPLVNPDALDDQTLRSTDEVYQQLRRKLDAEREAGSTPAAEVQPRSHSEPKTPPSSPDGLKEQQQALLAEEDTTAIMRHEDREKASGEGGVKKKNRRKKRAHLAAVVTARHVGRKPVLDDLIAQLRKARKTGVRAVLVEGEEGVGKTRLLHTFRGLAWVKGGRVAIGRCHPSGGANWAPFHDILLRLAGPGLARSHSERLLGTERDLLLRFFPALGTSEGPLDGATTTGTVTLGDDVHDRVQRAVCEVLRRAARDGPLVIGIEDVHWADMSTIRLVRMLLRRLAPPTEAPVLLVLTYRGEELTSSDATRPMLIPSISDLENVSSVQVDPLGIEEIREVIQSVTVDVAVSSTLVDRLAVASGGNPRYAVEVARSLVEAGGAAGDDAPWELPDALRTAYARRLNSLNKAARDVARCIALIGRNPPLLVLRGASGLGGVEFEDAIGQLENRRVIDVDRRGHQDLATLHSEALRTAVLDSISTSQGRALHRRAAAAWLKAGGEIRGASAQAARHLYAAGEERAAFPHALEAAHEASEAYDLNSVRRWMAQIGDPGKALRAVSAAAVYRYHMLRFTVALSDGDLDRAQEAIEAAASVAPEERDQLETAHACAKLHLRTGNYLAAVQLCRRGLKDGRRMAAEDLAVRFSLSGAKAARRSGDPQSALAWLAEADLLVSGNPELESLAVSIAWTRSAALLDLHQEDEAETEVHRAIQLAIRSDKVRAEAGFRTNLAVLAWRRGDLIEARTQLERAGAIFEEMGEGESLPASRGNLAQLDLLEGDLEAANRGAQAAWAGFRRLRDRDGTISSAATVLAVARARQDEPEAKEVMKVVGEGPPAGQGQEVVWTEYWLEKGRWHLSREEHDPAWTCAQHAVRAQGPQPPPYRQRSVDLLRAELLYHQGQYARALPIFAEVSEGAHSAGHKPTYWWARSALSATQAQLNQDVDGPTPPAIEVANNIPLALSTLWYTAESLAAQGMEEAAEVAYREGLQIARDTGFIDWANRCLRSLGQRS